MNSSDASNQLDELTENEPTSWGAILFFAISILATVLLWLNREHAAWVEALFALAAATTISIVIWQACDPFAAAAQWVGIKLRLPSSVRGATLDAIASSMPELFTGLFFVTIALTGDLTEVERMKAGAEGYGATIATCAGSSIYNMILIPAICAIAISYSRRSKPEIAIERKMIARDGSWLLFTQFGLLYFLFQPQLTWSMAAIAIAAYVVYVLHLTLDTRQFQKKLAKGEIIADEAEGSSPVLFNLFEVQLNSWTAPAILIVSTLVAAAACYFLVELTRESAVRLEIPAFFVAVILTAAVSSIPDTFVSLGSANRGDDSGAMSNVFGSNIFDICIGMSIPLMVGCYLNDWQPITLIDENDQTLRGVVGLRVFLFVLTLIGIGWMWRAKRLTRRAGWGFVLLYASFVAYAILGALQIIPT